MKTYQNRPLFEFAVDWNRKPAARIEYDLKTLALGYAPELFYGDESFVRQGWSFEVLLSGAQAMAEFDRFFEKLKGRLVGFWLPTPVRAFNIAAGIGGSSFKAATQSLAEALAETSERHVYLVRGTEAQAAQVTECVDNHDGTYTVTVDADLDPEPDETWLAYWLVYVRLAGDVESAQFLAEQLQVRQVQVIELPHEYATAETGSIPITFYHFDTQDEAQSWRYTNWAWDVEINSIPYSSARIESGRMRMDATGIVSEMNIDADIGLPPFDVLCPNKLSLMLNVEIRTADWDDPVNQTVLFKGQMSGATVNGKQVTLNCKPLEMSRGSLPGFFFQPRCNYRVYDVPTCKAFALAQHFHQGKIHSRVGRLVSVEGAGVAGLAENVIAHGWLQTDADGVELERRVILANTAEAEGKVILTLNLALQNAGIGDTVYLVDGCDGSAAMCASKFNNFVNWGGHRYATRNLGLKAVELPPISGGKK